MKTRNPSILLLLIMSIALVQCSDTNIPDAPEPTEAEEEPTTIVEETIVEEEAKEPSKVKGAETAKRKPLTLVVNNLRSGDAPVLVGLYDKQENFLYPEGRLKEYKFIPVGTTLTAQINDRAYGEYAIAIYQDENSSGAIDKNMLGVPKEGYCFSNNVKPLVKAPSFKACKFDYDEASNTITMEMIW